MFFSLRDKVAIVTGGASGIGLAVARRFSKAGAKVMLADICDASELAKEIDGKFLRTDVSIEDEVARVIGTTIREFGRLDIMVNNAGIQPLGVDFSGITEALLTKAFQTNVNGVAFGIKYAARVMKHGGRIINTASFVGLIGAPKAAVYGPTRAAVVQLTRLAAMELAALGITVNCICPGTVRTPAVLDIPDNPEIPFVEKRTPLGRLAEPEEIAAAFHFLASDDASYLTGAIVPVDGGITAGWREYDVVVPSNIVDGKWIG